MKEHFKKAAGFIKTHKKEIVIGTLVGAGTIALGVFGVKKLTGMTPKIDFLECADDGWSGFNFGPDESAAAFQFGIGETITVWNESDRTHMIVNDIPLTDCGKFGEALIEKFGTVDGEKMDIIMALSQKYIDD